LLIILDTLHSIFVLRVYTGNSWFYSWNLLQGTRTRTRTRTWIQP